MSEKKILIRVDASSTIGIGHLMRCWALAQCWKRQGGEVVFAVKELPRSLQTELMGQRFKVARLRAAAGSRADAIEASGLAKKLDIKNVVIDGYGFDGAYQKKLKTSGLKLLSIDDHGRCDHYFTDLVLNPNLFARKDLYRNREPYTQLLIGAPYALIRKEFLKRRSRRKQIAKVATKVLVTMGGSDDRSVLSGIYEELQRLDNRRLEVVMIAGPANPDLDALKRRVLSSKFKVRLYKQAEDISALMAWADIAVSGAGHTCFEMACMGLPAILLILAENQKKNGEELISRGLAMNGGEYPFFKGLNISEKLEGLMRNFPQRQEMSAKGQKLIDGLGAARATDKMKEVA